MSEEALRQLMERLQSDDAFRQAMVEDPVAATSDLELSSTEIEALSSNDEDALRRLAGVETALFEKGIGVDLGGLSKLRRTVQGCYTEFNSGCGLRTHEKQCMK